MDKETQRNMLIAIGLSLAIMILWNYFFQPKQPKELPPQQASQQVYEQQAKPAAPGTPQVEFQSVTQNVPTEIRAEARDVEVKTAHMTATFSTLGGGLVSLQLPEYHSKRGGAVELVPQATGMESPLSLQFHSAQFGTRAEDFIYEHKLYNPSDSSVKELAEAAVKSSSEIPLGADEARVRQVFERQLPQIRGHEDLRTFVIAALSDEIPPDSAAKPAAGRARALEDDTILLFSHQMTPDLRLLKGFIFGTKDYSFVMYTVFRNTGNGLLKLNDGHSSYSVVWAPGLESPELTPKADELVGVNLVGKAFSQKPIRKLKEENEYPEDLQWIGLKRKYFFATLEPSGGLLNAKMQPLGQKQEIVGISLNMRPIEIESHDLAVNSIRVCAGPMLKEVLDSCGTGYGQILNFGFFDVFGKMLLAALLWLNKAVQNYGIAIILLTILVRLALFPLNQKSYKSMRAMQALQPKVTELREKYKKNPQEMNKKMMELYRENKVNPMGGCLPIAFQMPIFIALFQALRNAVELRGAHFLWMADLSEPDKLFTINQPFHFSLNLLPLLVILAMVIQQKMTPMAATGQNEAQQKMMQYMPIIFGFFFYTMPSGLTVYFLISTVLGLVQQYFVQKAA